jgi:hypothetical protein
MNSATGKAVYLTGSHTWANLQERMCSGSARFDFEEYLDFLGRHRHNFIRLWAWEHTASLEPDGREVLYEPHPFMRTGPGNALDGKPKFDLSRFSKGYFDRLRDRVIAARERSIYVSVMLFQGSSLEPEGEDPEGNPWDSHPFHKDNNINGINGDPFGDGHGREVHTTAILPIVEIHESYVRQVVDSVNDLDNVLFEISNNSHRKSTKWQHRMMDLVREYELGKGQRHPVGMTFQGSRAAPGTNADLFGSPADWISPNAEAGAEYRDDPPPADGRKVIINDTNRLWGMAADDEAETVRAWVWKSFLRGCNPIFMDPYLDVRAAERLDKRWEPVRLAMGYTRVWADRVSLAAMTPHQELASTGYCLADPGGEYLAYQPRSGAFTVDLAPGAYQFAWFEPRAGKVAQTGNTEAGKGESEFTPPFEGDALLHLKASGPQGA